MLCESLSPTFTLPDDELFLGAVVRMTSMRDSPCGVRYTAVYHSYVLIGSLGLAGGYSCVTTCIIRLIGGKQFSKLFGNMNILNFLGVFSVTI